MNRYLKYGLAAVAGMAFLFALLLVSASLLINPNDYKPQIIQLVKDKKQRTLTLPGDIKLAFFPKLGFDLGRASISEFQSVLVAFAEEGAGGGPGAGGRRARQPGALQGWHDQL
jgi:AsmA protein